MRGLQTEERTSNEREIYALGVLEVVKGHEGLSKVVTGRQGSSGVVRGCRSNFDNHRNHHCKRVKKENP